MKFLSHEFGISEGFDARYIFRRKDHEHAQERRDDLIEEVKGKTRSELKALRTKIRVDRSGEIKKIKQKGDRKEGFKKEKYKRTRKGFEKYKGKEYDGEKTKVKWKEEEEEVKKPCPPEEEKAKVDKDGKPCPCEDDKGKDKDKDKSKTTDRSGGIPEKTGAKVTGTERTGAVVTGKERRGAVITGTEKTGAVVTGTEKTGSTIDGTEKAAPSLSVCENTGVQVEMETGQGATITLTEKDGATLMAESKSGASLEVTTSNGAKIEVTEKDGATLTAEQKNGLELSSDERIGAILEMKPEDGVTITSVEKNGAQLEVTTSDGGVVQVDAKGQDIRVVATEQNGASVLLSVIDAETTDLIGEKIDPITATKNMKSEQLSAFEGDSEYIKNVSTDSVPYVVQQADGTSQEISTDVIKVDFVRDGVDQGSQYYSVSADGKELYWYNPESKTFHKESLLKIVDGKITVRESQVQKYTEKQAESVDGEGSSESAENVTGLQAQLEGIEKVKNKAPGIIDNINRFSPSVNLDPMPEEMERLFDSKPKLRALETLLELGDEFWGDYQMSYQDLLAFAQGVGGFGRVFDGGKNAFKKVNEKDEYYSMVQGKLQEVPKNEKKKELFEVQGSHWWDDYRFSSAQAFLVWLKTQTK